MENSKQPAFAAVAADSYLQEGLTKREYFAAIAMQGILSNESFYSRMANEANNYMINEISTASIKMADEILKQLEK